MKSVLSVKLKRKEKCNEKPVSGGRGGNWAEVQSASLSLVPELAALGPAGAFLMG